MTISIGLCSDPMYIASHQLGSSKYVVFPQMPSLEFYSPLT